MSKWITVMTKNFGHMEEVIINVDNISYVNREDEGDILYMNNGHQLIVPFSKELNEYIRGNGV